MLQPKLCTQASELCWLQRPLLRGTIEKLCLWLWAFHANFQNGSSCAPWCLKWAAMRFQMGQQQTQVPFQCGCVNLQRQEKPHQEIAAWRQSHMAGMFCLPGRAKNPRPQNSVVNAILPCNSSLPNGCQYLCMDNKRRHYILGVQFEDKAQLAQLLSQTIMWVAAFPSCQVECL